MATLHAHGRRPQPAAAPGRVNLAVSQSGDFYVGTGSDGLFTISRRRAPTP